MTGMQALILPTLIAEWKIRNGEKPMAVAFPWG